MLPHKPEYAAFVADAVREYEDALGRWLETYDLERPPASPQDVSTGIAIVDRLQEANKAMLAAMDAAGLTHVRRGDRLYQVVPANENHARMFRTIRLSDILEIPAAD